MNLESKVRELAFRSFGRWVRERDHKDLQKNLRKANLQITSDMYVSLSVLFSVLTSALTGIVGIFMWFWGLGPNFLPPLILGIAPLQGLLVYWLFLTYPSIAAQQRSYKIDEALLQVIGFMHAMSKAGSGVTEIFREFSIRQNVPGFSEETKKFMRDVEYLGCSQVTAINNLSKSTPSQKLREFLETLSPIVQTGGNLSSFLKSKWSEYLEEVKDYRKRYFQSLELLSEIYITIAMLFPLLLLVVLIVLGPVKGLPEAMIYLVVYLGIPAGSGICIGLVSIAAPERVSISSSGTKRTSRGERDVEELLKEYSSRKIGGKLKSILKKPIDAVYENPAYVLVFSVPIGVVVFLLSFGQNIGLLGSLPTLELGPSNSLILASLVALVPYSLAYEIKWRRIGEYEDSLQDFLRSLSSGLKSGLTFPASLKISAKSNFGPLTKELRRMTKHMEFGLSSSEALSRFSQRMKESDLITRATITIRKARQAGEELTEVIDSLTQEISAHRELKMERKRQMNTYRIIILLMFGMFLFAVYMVATNILSAGASGTNSLLLGGTNMQTIARSLMHATVLEGLFAGLMAGQIGSGDLRSGLKYSVVMIALSQAAFLFLIFPAL